PRLIGALLALQPSLTTGLGKRADAADIGGALGDGNHPARIQQVEAMAGLDALVIGRKRQFRRSKQLSALFLGILEMLEQDVRIGALEIIGGEFLFGLMEHLAVAELLVELQV